MPMFGSSKKHDNDTAVADIMDSNTTGGGRHHAAHPTNQAAMNDYPAAGMANANTFGQTHPPSGPGGAHYTNTNFQTGPGQHGQHAAFAQDDPYTAGGVGSAHHPGGRGIPPTTGALDHHGAGAAQSGPGSGGAGGRLAGKIETAIGTIVGSDALKAKGLQQEHAAAAVKLQGRELAEAEREALVRRERAVAHGADPANSALGAGNPGAGNMGAGNPGVGTGHSPGLF
ncbi:hypothetical protein BJ912DRAFT_1061852 [Pholiota molesta]|nr:hypothetical protein BJ912DRAFT_1061852 [Pholiota molesta]